MGVKSTYYPPGRTLTFNEWQAFLKEQRDGYILTRKIEFMLKSKPRELCTKK